MAKLKAVLIGASGYATQTDTHRLDSFGWHQLDKLSNLRDYDAVVISLLENLPAENNVHVWNRFAAQLNQATCQEITTHGGKVIIVGEPRTIPYGSVPALVEVVEAQWTVHEKLKSKGVINPWVFPARGTNPVKTFRKAWKTATILAGVPGRIFHDFRRTAVRNFEQAGIPRSVAMEITGHKTEAIYRRYAIVSTRDTGEALRRVAANS